MTTTSFARGRLRVTHPTTYHATTTRSRTRSLDIGTSDAVDALVVETLRQNGFQNVHRVVVAPVRSRGASTGGRGSATVSLALDVEASQDAVVLVESDGCYSWLLPSPEPRSREARGAGPRVATFQIEVPAVAGGIRELSAGTDGVRATVLTYASPLVSRAAIGLLEAHLDPGLVHITGADISQWRTVAGLDEVGIAPDRTNRVLLLVHGTFDSTAGAFAGLTVTTEGRAFLEAALGAYDAVVGFDHKTLSVDPLANAVDLGERLARLPAQRQVTIDVVCHSRGGLTARSFVEQVLPGLAWRGEVDRVVFVAATNAGTQLADAARWSDLADLYTNLVVAKARAIADLPGGGPVAGAAVATVRGIGALVRWLASYATDAESVPGIAAMAPAGPFVTAINEDQTGQPRPGTPWFVVSSNFEATVAEHPKEIPVSVVSRLVDGVVDHVFTGDNDLVVDVTSMSAIDLPHGGGYVRDELDLGTNAVVYHTNYFTQDVVADALSTWLVDRADRADRLEQPSAAVVPPPTARPAPKSAVRRQRGPTAGPVLDAEPPPRMAEPPPEPVPANPPIRAAFVAELPQRSAVGMPTTLRVRLSRSRLTPADGTASAHTVLAVHPEVPVDVQVIATTNAVLDGSDLDRLLLPPGGGWAELQFTVHAVSAGPLRLTVLARQGRELLGRVVLEAEAVDPADVVGAEQALTTAQVEVASSTSPVLADVAWLEIAQLQRDGRTVYQYELRLPGSADRIVGTSAPIHDVDTFVANLFREVQQLWFDSSDQPKKYLADLQDLGAALFEQLFPQDLQAVLWRNRDRLDNLFLIADEPYIPWELVHLKPPKGPRQKASRFLGQLGLVRWQFTPFPAAPYLQARAGKVFAVCPEYADPSLDLVEVRTEAAFLTSTLGATTVQATEQKVRGLLRRRGGFDVLHFSGHGTADPANIGQARIVLAGRTVGGALVSDYLSSTTVAQNARLANGEGTGPLVVLNACQVGRAGQELTSLGGFARAFLEAGASAFVSCLWSVNETPARVFVEAFYERLLAGDTVATAAVTARSAARRLGDATWLAYVVYARPDAVLVRG